MEYLFKICGCLRFRVFFVVFMCQNVVALFILGGIEIIAKCLGERLGVSL